MDYTDRIKALQAMLVGVDCCKNNIQDRTDEVSRLEEIGWDIWTGSNCNGIINDYISTLKEKAKKVNELHSEVEDTIKKRIETLKSMINDQVDSYEYLTSIHDLNEYSEKRSDIEQLDKR